MKDNSYIVIQSFMINDLKLKGNDLLVYAIIHGFSQDGSSHFTGSLGYLAEWTNSSKQGIEKNLKNLMKKKLIGKVEKEINKVKFCEYYCLPLCNKVEQGMQQSLMGMQQSLMGGMQQSLMGMQQSLMGGMQQSLTNNIDIDNIDNNIDIDNIDNNLEDNISTLNRVDCRTNTVRRTQAQLIIDTWNNMADEYGIAKISELNDNTERGKWTKARIKQYKLEGVLKAIEKIRESDFLQGRTGDRPFLITYDWFIRPNNFIKVKDGNYDNNKNVKSLSDDGRIHTGSAYMDAIANRYDDIDRWAANIAAKEKEVIDT